MNKLTEEEIKEYLEEFVCEIGQYSEFVKFMEKKGYVTSEFE